MTVTPARPSAGAGGLEGAILAQAADAIIFTDRDGVVRLWNRGAEVVFGYTAAEVLGQGLDIIIPEAFRRAHDQGFQRAMATGQLRNEGRVLTTRAQGKYGNRLYIDFSFSLVKDAEGAVSGAVAIGRDVTAAWLEKAAERKRAEAAAARPANG